MCKSQLLLITYILKVVADSENILCLIKVDVDWISFMNCLYSVYLSQNSDCNFTLCIYPHYPFKNSCQMFMTRKNIVFSMVKILNLYLIQWRLYLDVRKFTCDTLLKLKGLFITVVRRAIKIFVELLVLYAVARYSNWYVSDIVKIIFTWQLCYNIISPILLLLLTLNYNRNKPCLTVYNKNTLLFKKKKLAATTLVLVCV